jgi:hypothetical protein
MARSAIAEEMRELLWYGEKMKAGDTPTEEETATMFRQRERTCTIARYMFNLKPEDYEYTKGKPFS